MSSQEPPIKFHTVAQILSLPDPEWLIKDILVKSSLAVLFGAPGVGKSFLALSWAFAVAAGKPWLGRKVKGGPVVYVAAEGFGGLKLRVAALLSREGYGDDTPCRFLGRPINLTASEKVEAFITEIRKSVEQPALIIVDTLARCFVGGDENSAQHMGLFIDGVETLRRETGATVLVVHHAGKIENRGARGSGALMGAADTMISCGGKKGFFELKCEKQKDAEPFKEFPLKLRKVELGNGRNSCVPVRFDAPADVKSAGSDATSKKVLAALEKFEPDGATATEWEEACEKADITRETFYRRRTKLHEAGKVEKDGDGQGARYRPVNSKPVSVSG